MVALTVIARLEAEAGREEECAVPCRGLVAPTRAEKSCVAYDLQRSHDDPGLFMFAVFRESRSPWEDHMKPPTSPPSGRSRTP